MTPHETITHMLAHYAGRADVLNNRLWPKGMPINPQEAAAWWMNHIERPTALETQGHVHQEPYTERASYLLKKFLKLKPIDQQLVIGAAEDGISWRGDDMGMFRTIINEHGRMQDMGIEAYRKEALKAVKRVFG